MLEKPVVEEKGNLVVFNKSKRTVDSAKFPPSAIFVRDAYRKLTAYMSKHRCKDIEENGKDDDANQGCFVITGTPGIGKSMFIFYLVFRFFFDHIDGFDIRNIILLTTWGKYVLQRDEKDIVRYTKVSHPWEYDYLLHPEAESRHRTAVFWDTGNSKELAALVQPTVATLEMVFMSPNESRFIKFYDKHHGLGERAKMPLWSDLEFETLRNELFSRRITQEDAIGLAKLYGNNPRLVLQLPADRKRRALSVDQHRLHLEDLIVQLKLDQLHQLIKMENIADESREESAKYYHALLQISTAVDPQSGEYLFEEDASIHPASAFVKKQLVFRFLLLELERNKECLRDFLNAASGDGKAYAGWMFEWYAHYEVGKMRELACISLGEDPVQRAFDCDWSGGREVFRKLNDMKGGIQPNTYYLPAHQTLPSIDSFVVLDGEDANGNDVRRVLAFQMTVASSHPVKRQGVKALQDMLDSEAKKPDEYHLVFVAPEHEDESRAMTSVQELMNEDGSTSKESVFSQWRLDIPLSDLRLMEKCKYDA